MNTIPTFVRNYSLANHTLYLQNDDYNVIIGNGSSAETITVSYANENFSYTMSADGTGTLNKNKMRNGTISVSLNQANSICDQLKNVYKSQLEGSSTAPATITIRDSDGNINSTYTGCVITKIPDYSAGNESASREFSIIFLEGTEN